MRKLKLIYEVNLRFETQINVRVQTQKWKTCKWEAEFQVYFNRPSNCKCQPKWQALVANCFARGIAGFLQFSTVCSSFTVQGIWMFDSWPLTLLNLWVLNLWVLNLWFYVTIDFNWNLTSARGHGIFSALDSTIIFWQLFHNLGNSEGIATFLVKWCSGDSNLTTYLKQLHIW